MNSVPQTPQQSSTNNHRLFSPSEESDEEADPFVIKGSNASLVRDDQRQALNELNFRDNWETDDDVDAYLAQLGDRPEYDVREKLKLINKEWSTDGEDLTGRKTKVVFRDELVDLISPRPDYEHYPPLSEADEEDEETEHTQAVSGNSTSKPSPSTDHSPPNPKSVNDLTVRRNSFDKDDTFVTDSSSTGSADETGMKANEKIAKQEQTYLGESEEDENPDSSSKKHSSQHSLQPKTDAEVLKKDKVNVVPPLNLNSNVGQKESENQVVSNQPTPNVVEAQNASRNNRLLSEYRSTSSPLPEEEEVPEKNPPRQSGRVLVFQDGRYDFVDRSTEETYGKEKLQPELQTTPLQDTPNNNSHPISDRDASHSDSHELELYAEEEKEDIPSRSESKSSNYSSEQYSDEEKNHSEDEERFSFGRDESQRVRSSSASVSSSRKAEQEKTVNGKSKRGRSRDGHSSNTGNERIFLAWLERKKRQLAEEKRRHSEERKQQGESGHKSQKDSEEAVKNWKKKKRKQRREETRLREAQEDEGKLSAIRHSETECKKAFRKWLRRKERERREQEELERERIRLANLALRKSRRSQALAAAIERANNLGYNDYYGYRV